MISRGTLRWINLGVAIYSLLFFALALVLSILLVMVDYPAIALYADYNGQQIGVGIADDGVFNLAPYASLPFFFLGVSRSLLFLYHDKLFLPMFNRFVNYVRWLESALQGGVLIFLTAETVGISEFTYAMMLGFIFVLEMGFATLHEHYCDRMAGLAPPKGEEVSKEPKNLRGKPSWVAFFFAGCCQVVLWFVLLFYMISVINTLPGWVIALTLVLFILFSGLLLLLYLDYTDTSIWRHYDVVEVSYLAVWLVIDTFATWAIIGGLAAD
jgi:hypothetical protein